MIHNYILFALWMYLNESDELQVKQNRKGFNQLAPSDEKCKLKLIEDLAKVDSWWSSRSRTAFCGRQKFKRRQSEMNYHWLKLLPGAPVDTNQASGSPIEGDIRAWGCTALQVVLGMGWYDIKGGKFLLTDAHLKFRFFAWLAELWLMLGEYLLFLKMIIHFWLFKYIDNYFPVLSVCLCDFLVICVDVCDHCFNWRQFHCTTVAHIWTFQFRIFLLQHC